MGTTYVSRCPVHLTKLTCVSEDMVTFNYKGQVKKKEPVFFCPECKRYYAYSKAREGTEPKDSKQKLKGFPLFWSGLDYYEKPEGGLAPKPENTDGG